jgi:hypothetical protein
MLRRLGTRRSFRVGLALVTVVAALTIVGVALAAVVTIDSFNSDTVVANANNTTTDVTNSILSSEAIGGQRDIRAVWNTGANVRIAVNDGAPASQAAAFSTDSSTNGYATITWDGQNASNTLNFGLNANLLSSNPANTVFRLRITNNDLPVTVTLRAYTTDANTYSEYSARTQGNIFAPQVVDLVYPFTPVTAQGPNGPAVATDIDAIELTIDNRIPGSDNADFTIDQFDVLPTMADFGDLPNTYGAAITTTHHLRPSYLRLGTNVDVEVDGQPSVGANGDNTASGLDVNDEEGVNRHPTTKWSVASGGRLRYTVSGCDDNDGNEPCYLSAWIDFNRDNDFNDALEQIYVSQAVANGTVVYQTIPVPSGTTFPGVLYARFRLCGGRGFTDDCSTPTGVSVSGEIEDYAWDFGPLAVTLESLEAQSNTSPVLPVALIGVSAAVLIGVVFLVRRRKMA